MDLLVVKIDIPNSSYKLSKIITLVHNQIVHISISRATPLPVCQEPLNRVALHSHQPHPPDAHQEPRQSTAHNFCSSLLASTLQVHKKLTSFESLWPNVLRGQVGKMLKEYDNIDQEMQTMLEQL